MADAVVQIIDERVVVEVEGVGLIAPLVAEARTSRDQAVTAAAAAQLAQAAALSVGVMYATRTAGLNATVEGGYFLTPGDDAYSFVILYRKTSGAAVEVDRFANRAAFIDFQQRAEGAQVNTIRGKLAQQVSLLDFIPEALHADIFACTSTVNLTQYFAAALSYVQTLPRGGTIAIPAGSYTMDMDCSRTLAEFEQRINIVGAGRGATQIKPTRTGAIMLNMVGRNVMTVARLTLQAGDRFRASIGILQARSEGSQNANNCKFSDVEVVGNFSKACVVSVAAESTEWHNCRIAPGPGSSGVCLILGDDPAAPNIAITVPGHTLQANANTDIRFLDCEFYQAAIAGKDLVMLSGGHSAHFTTCAWIAPGARSLVRFCDPNTGIMGGNTSFTACHFEGDGAQFWVDVDGVAYLRGIHDVASTSVMGPGSQYLSYNRSTVDRILVLEQCHFLPGRPLNPVQVGFNAAADIVSNTTIDFTQIGSSGAVSVFLQAENSKLWGFSLKCWRAIQSHVFKAATIGMPTAGVYHKGAVVQEAGLGGDVQLQMGAPAAYVALAGGSIDADPGGMTCVTTAGSCEVRMRGDYALYEGARIYVGDFGYATVRGISGRLLYLTSNMTAAGVKSLNFSGAIAGRFAPVGLIGQTQAEAQANALQVTAAPTQADHNALVAVVNGLLGKLRNARTIAT